jgi:V/A-type H+-transporting ATPase subunit A
VLRARTSDIFHVYEAIAVGPSALLGEVIKLGPDEFVAQIYEDTTGLKPGDRVTGSGQPLSVTLGPGMLGHIFDGLLRPLASSDEPFIRPGARLEKPRRFGFEPTAHPGDRAVPGQPVGRVATPRQQLCLIPPNIGAGTVRWVAAAGEYSDDESICRVEQEDGTSHEFALTHAWPVRRPRPIARRLRHGQDRIAGNPGQVVRCRYHRIRRLRRARQRNGGSAR